MQKNKETNVIPPFQLPRSVKLLPGEEADTIAWANKDVPKNVVSLLVMPLVWLVLVAVVGRIAYALLTGEVASLPLLNKLFVWLFFLVFGWFAFRLPTALKLELLGTETIIISDTEITINRPGYNKQFEKNRVLGLWFGRFDTGDGMDIVPNLYIAYTDQILGVTGRRTEQIAPWMRVKEKNELYLLMKQILEGRGWNIEYKSK
jgi:hypothetical protein